MSRNQFGHRGIPAASSIYTPLKSTKSQIYVRIFTKFTAHHRLYPGPTAIYFVSNHPAPAPVARTTMFHPKGTSDPLGPASCQTAGLELRGVVQASIRGLPLRRLSTAAAAAASGRQRELRRGPAASAAVSGAWWPWRTAPATWSSTAQSHAPAAPPGAGYVRHARRRTGIESVTEIEPGSRQVLMLCLTAASCESAEAMNQAVR